MRIVGGELGGRRIVAPPGRATRPTADRVREAVFNQVGPVEGVSVLDLFAGSGALGFEALSRGAAQATLVERSSRALAAIRKNAADLGLEERTRVVGADWRAGLARERAAGHVYGLVVIDPPYSLLPRIVGALGPAIAAIAAPGARVVLEHSASLAPPDLPDLPVGSRTDRRYGDAAVSVIRLSGPALGGAGW